VITRAVEKAETGVEMEVDEVRHKKSGIGILDCGFWIWPFS